ncbi:MAG TPA: glycosyltransferase family 1 protein, partial [Chloroflexota bacterium]
AGLTTSAHVKWQPAPDLPGRWRHRPGSRLWSNSVFTAIAAVRRPDVVFCPWLVVPKARVAPTVVTLHDVCFRTHPDSFADGGRRGDEVLAAAVESASEIVTPSAESKRGVVAAYGVDERRVTVVRHGIESVFNPVTDSRDTDRLRKLGIESPYFLCVSTHEPRKNLGVLARAFTCFVEQSGQHEGIPQLVLIGRPSPETARIVETLATSPLASRQTRFVDGLSDVELVSAYRRALAVVLPTVCEGFGFPLLEAIASGTPAIASDLAVFRELVDDAALFVPSGEVGAWVAALDRASVDTDLRHRALQAASRVRCQFSWRASAAETLRVLERAAGGG